MERKNYSLIVLITLIGILSLNFVLATTIILQSNETENLGDGGNKQASTADTGGFDYMYAGNNFGGYEALVQFNLSSIPAGQSIQSAELFLFTHDAPSSSTIYNLSTVDFFSEVITGGGFKTTIVDNVDSVVISDVDNLWYNWDVGSVVSSEYSSGEQNISFAIQNPTGNLIRFRTKEHTTSSERPYLNVTYTAAAGISNKLSLSNKLTLNDGHFRIRQ